jgi:AAA15 family ATPase/GTPase
MTIILALVNAENGFLLVDEFENGLHYSIQEKLWEITFNIAKSLNVQIFATTHSDDCIRGFEKALNNPDDKSFGQLIRLDLRNETVVQVEFNPEELKIASDQNIETR